LKLPLANVDIAEIRREYHAAAAEGPVLRRRAAKVLDKKHAPFNPTTLRT
jgi:hypothetical protein